MRCVTCGGTAHRQVPRFTETAGERQLPLYRCASCGLIRPRPLPYTGRTAAAFYADYTKKNSFDRASGDILFESAEYGRYRELFKPYVDEWRVRKMGGPLLDAGCGSGQLLFLAREAGLKPEGTEFDLGLVRALRKRKYTIHHGDLSVVRPGARDGGYGIITMNHVLEHIPDPGKFVRQAHRLLRKDGHLIIALPYIYGLYPRIMRTRWYGQGYGEHLNFFSKRSLRKLLEDNGFTVLRMHTYSLDHVPKGLPRILRPAITIPVGMMNLLELGDNLFVVARKD